MLEVGLTDLALSVAAEADALFANGTYMSTIQGIPFAIKDTFDPSGYATAFGSCEFMDAIVETESPLEKYVVEAYAVPPSSRRYRNSRGAMPSTGVQPILISMEALPLGLVVRVVPPWDPGQLPVCLGVVRSGFLCEQTGSSCQGPAAANGISTVIPAIGTLSRENNGLYSMESDRPGLHCREYNVLCRILQPGFQQEMRNLVVYPLQIQANKIFPIIRLASQITRTHRDGPGMGHTIPGKRTNVVETLDRLGATVIVKDTLKEFMEPTQLLKDYE